jgi:lipopolysaccharide biosynthesis glycosyltransferase
MNEYLDIFVGTDRSQLLAVSVLEFSIKRHTNRKVRVCPLSDLDLPEPKDIRQGSRTNFSFTRFAIPELMDFQGRALYLDADMLVFKDINQLWNIPFDGTKIIIQGDLKDKTVVEPEKVGAPKSRKKQCSVMMIDCSAVDWDVIKIIEGLDGRYNYEQLMSEMCLLDESEVSYALPFKWNSLEHYDEDTCLIHYTDMQTQPWVSTENRLGYLWMREVRLMLDSGVMSWRALEHEIDLGFFRPSLIHEVREIPQLKVWNEEAAKRYEAIDKQAGFVKHAEVYRRKKERAAAVKAYEEKLKSAQLPAAGTTVPAVAA